MRSRLLFLLLIQARHQRRGRQAGFSLAMTFIVILALILGTLAIVGRNSSGLLATALQGRNREARDVAEAGIQQVINELNRERNRRLLVFGPRSSWNNTDDRYKNDCTALADVPANTPFAAVTRPAGSTASAPTAEPLAFDVGANSTWVNLVSGQSNRQFRIIDIQYRNQQDRAATYPADNEILAGNVKTLIAVTVEGRVDGTQQTSTTRVTREFEVVPKCCKRSFGDNVFGANFFGRDNRSCYNETVGGTGVITSWYGGTVSTSNNTFSIIDDQSPPQPITQVLCREEGNNSSCLNGKWSLGKSISVVPTPFPYGFQPFPTAATPATTAGNLDMTITDGKTKDSRRYLRVNSSGDVQLCNPSSLSSCTNLSSPASGQASDRRCVSYAFDPDGAGPKTSETQYFCKVNSLNSTNTNTIIDSSRGTINLYFDNPGTPPLSSYQYALVGGNGSFSHVSCSTPSDSTACTTNATIASADRLNIFAVEGSPQGEPGTFDFRGTSAALAMNVYAPNSTVIWRGGGNQNPNFIGRLWANNLDIRGSIAMQVPVSSPTICRDASGNTVACNVQSGQPFVDFVARSVSYSSSF